MILSFFSFFFFYVCLFVGFVVVVVSLQHKKIVCEVTVNRCEKSRKKLFSLPKPGSHLCNKHKCMKKCL